MPSELEICNLALAHLGEAPIASLAASDAVSLACAAQYEVTRDACLRAHRWNFASARAALEVVDDVPAFGWGHQFDLPESCLRVLEFNGSEEGDMITSPFVIEGSRLLTDDAEAKVVYIQRIEDTDLFDPLFVEALAVRLASKLSEMIRGTTKKTSELEAAYATIVAPLARRVDANEGRRRKGLISLNSPALRARGRSPGWPRRAEDFST